MNHYIVYQAIYLLVITLCTFPALAQYRKTVSDFGSYYSNHYDISKNAALLLCIICTLFIGLRPEGGLFSDSLNYRTYYYLFYDGQPFVFDPDAENKIFDNLFALWGSLKLGCGGFFFLIAVIYFGCIYAACRRFFMKDSYIAVLCYLAAFSTFSYSCNGIKAGVAAAIFLLALSYYKKWMVSIPLVMLSWGMHHSMTLPVAVYILCYFYKNPKHFFYAWLFCLVMAVLHVGFFATLFASLSAANNDLRGAEYLTASTSEDWDGKAGFRLDFVLYSAMPILVGYYAIFKKGIHSDFYSLLLRFYLITNAVWMLCMYVQYSNRIAYLSWFVYPIVLIYPFLNERWDEKQLLTLVKVVKYHLYFTLFMQLIYYRGLIQLFT